MNQKLGLAIILSLTSLSLVQAMDMTSNNMMKKDATGAMMAEATSSMINTTMQGGMSSYDSVMMTSKKADITKLQMMLVTKGYLSMPKGVAYGHYGSLTKIAHKKYKMSSMMVKSDSDASMVKATTTMMNH